MNRADRRRHDRGRRRPPPPPFEPSWWLRNLIAAGPRIFCPHIHLERGSVFTGPVITWTVWNGRLGCLRCPLVLEEPGSEADRSCDRCGHICPDQDGQRILPTILVIGRLLVGLGLCPECARKEDPRVMSHLMTPEAVVAALRQWPL
jgi:hypothetical protein